MRSVIRLLTRGIVVAGVLTFSHLVYAQAFTEIEPNDACFAAQNIGPVTLPASVFGSLDSTAERPDIDFFLFEGVPNQQIVVDMEGASTGAGTLGDPLLGLFSSDCAQLAINDDSGGGLNSRLSFRVPDDGVFVLGATACCDFAFEGGGQGSYLLSLHPFLAIESISGQLINAETGQPLSGIDFPFASVQLIRCNLSGCFEFIVSQQTDSDGRFFFDADQFGAELSVGTYQIQANAQGFEYFIGETFTVSENEAADLGGLGLTPLQLIGSLSGRLIDAFSGNPLAGNMPPYPIVYLQRCDEITCFVVAAVNPGDEGQFRFDGPSYNLGPGTFQLLGIAEDYQDTTSEPFSVAAFEDVDVGDFALKPLPIQFGEITPCEIPQGGGRCAYSIEITNRGDDRRFRGAVWSTVEFYSPPSFRATRFQVGRGGARHPAPENLNLKRGEKTTLTFELEVPASVPDESTLCGYVSVGEAPLPQYNSRGDRFIFCSVKQGGDVAALPEKQGRKRMKELRGRHRIPIER